MVDPLLRLLISFQGPMKVITVCITPPYGHAPTYQISLTYLERQKCYGRDKKILFKKQLLGQVRSPRVTGLGTYFLLIV
jgi:hypothetical protein